MRACVFLHESNLAGVRVNAIECSAMTLAAGKHAALAFSSRPSCPGTSKGLVEDA